MRMRTKSLAIIVDITKQTWMNRSYFNQNSSLLHSPKTEQVIIKDSSKKEDTLAKYMDDRAK